MNAPTLDWYRHSPTPSVYDEALDEHGQVRAPWASLARRLAGLGEHGLAERRRRCEHLLAAHGATHIPHRELIDDGALAPGWRLDPIPLVIGRAEWSRLAAGVAERARLLAAVAADFAGPQRLLHDGIVPAAAVYGDPAFLPLAPTGWVNPMLWYGADLVRDAQGNWRVLRDVTDVPRGLGEALLHRSVVARVLGDLSDRPGPAPLTDHLDDLRMLLGRVAPARTTSPRTVVLTPEAAAADYLAVAHLTAQLGFHRTSAADLVVRDRRVWLRSLGGLEPVDVVLRSLPAADLDPLTNARRGTGVPGLVQAERAGAVAIANPVSAGLAGSVSVAPHLDAAARHLLGATPSLPAAPIAWCGSRDVVADVLADPEQWVLHDALTGESTFGSVLSADGRHAARAASWRDRLLMRPASLVAHARIPLATAPIVHGGHAVPGALVLGVSALIDGDDVHVLPGGFARVVEPGEPIVGQHSGWAKDVWVYEARSARPTVTVPRLPQVDLRQSVPTRAAEAMYWLGRAAEGAEVQARLVAVIAERLATGAGLDGAGPGSWYDAAAAMLRATGTPGGDEATGLDVYLADAVRGRNGLVERLDQVLVAAGSVREFLSTATGRVLADLDNLRRTARAGDGESLEQVLVSLAGLAGLAQESTVRGPAWRMLDLGRRTERALAVLGSVEAALGVVTTRDSFQAIGETLLAGHESLNAYRRMYRTDVELDALVDLLVVDDTNPRSVAFQLDRIVEHLVSLPTSVAQRELARDAASSIVEMFARAPDVAGQPHGGIVSLVLAVRGPLLALADSFVRQWFADPVGPHRLGGGEP